ncbi:hypothetical protein C7S16_4816 [Burkholderia thailandensis]|uniref:Uncharacterized protein n=1 Tax=Burkholderia thailandensis TaxID=57975 RepID=A0AAW9CKU6_BURTH|nr:hypothetical protein [Burkholderia thailandensis]
MCRRRAGAGRLNSAFETFAPVRAITGVLVAIACPGPSRRFRRASGFIARSLTKSHRCNIGESTIGTRQFTNIAASPARPPRSC